MRKSVVVVFSLLLIVALSVAAADSSLLIGSDLPAGWYFLPTGVSVSVPDGVDSPSLLSESPSFTVPKGEYVAGVDFPSGEYSIRCADGFDSVTIRFCREVDGPWYSIETLYSESGDFLGKMSLGDGYWIQVRGGSAFFSAPVGIVFE